MITHESLNFTRILCNILLAATRSKQKQKQKKVRTPESAAIVKTDNLRLNHTRKVIHAAILKSKSALAYSVPVQTEHPTIKS